MTILNSRYTRGETGAASQSHFNYSSAPRSLRQVHTGSQETLLLVVSAHRKSVSNRVSPSLVF